MGRVLVLTCAAALLAGCITRESANVYARDEAGREQAVLPAIVSAVHAHPASRWILGREKLEITARTDTGDTRAVVQEADLDLQVGQRVHLLESGTRTRVTP